MRKTYSFGEGKNIAVLRTWHTLNKIDYEVQLRLRLGVAFD